MEGIGTGVVRRPQPRGRIIPLTDNEKALVRRAVGQVVLYAAVILIISIVAFPLFYMLASSFKPREEIYVSPPTLLPVVWTVDNYVHLVTETNFPRYFRNSAVVATGATLLSMIVASFGGYALSRFRYRGFGLFARATLFAYMLPSIMLVIPLYVLVVNVGMADTLQSLIITNTTFTLPFALWLLRSYFSSIPIELEQAAMIDGCTRFQALRRVILPLALPGIVATSIFAFTNSWNEFLYAMVFITSDSLRTLPPGMGTFVQSDNIYRWGVLMAGSVLITIPALIFYMLVQRNLVVDLSAGGVKE